MSEFPDEEELRNVVRNCDRLFPPFPRIRGSSRQQHAAAQRIKTKFTGMVRATAKVKLSAELELKLRALYYDVIEPESVEGVIKSIYEGSHMHKLELSLSLCFLVCFST